jgi:xanthine dehydrogenase accessory factor
MPRDLHDTLAEYERMRQTERRAVLATLVATEGTTPKKEGATMWVGEGGRILGSVTIGGCIDAQVVSEAATVLSTGAPSLLALSLRDEEGWDLGLTCGGRLRVLVEPVRFDTPDPVAASYDVTRRELLAGRRLVMAFPLNGRPARLLVHEDGTAEGTLGTPALDRAAREQALQVLAAGKSQITTVRTDATGVELFFGLYAPPPRLLVFGATHVAMPLVVQASTLGWNTTVLDARERFATRERFPTADTILVGELGRLAEQQHLDRSSYVVIVTHDYKFELPVLRTVLPRDPAYVGLLASRQRAQLIREYLAADGISPDLLDRIHTPIGLRVGAETAAEIALSILAEIVAVRNGRSQARVASS